MCLVLLPHVQFRSKLPYSDFLQFKFKNESIIHYHFISDFTILPTIHHSAINEKYYFWLIFWLNLYMKSGKTNNLCVGLYIGNFQVFNQSEKILNLNSSVCRAFEIRQIRNGITLTAQTRPLRYSSLYKSKWHSTLATLRNVNDFGMFLSRWTVDIEVGCSMVFSWKSNIWISFLIK